MKIYEQKTDVYIAEWLNTNGWVKKVWNKESKANNNKLRAVWKDPFYYGKLVVKNYSSDQTIDNPHYKPMITFAEYELLQSRMEGSKPKDIQKKRKDELRSKVLSYQTPSTLIWLCKLFGESIAEIEHTYHNQWSTSLILKNPKEAKYIYRTKEIADYLYDLDWTTINTVWMYLHEQIELNHTNWLDRKKMYQVTQKPTYTNAKNIIKHYSQNDILEVFSDEITDNI